jgi:hypothetical protein
MSAETQGRSGSWLDYFRWTRKEATGAPTPSADVDRHADAQAACGLRKKTYREALLGGAQERDAALLHETYFFV